MGPTVTFLFSVGLCLDWTMRAQTDPLPRPTLWAIPSPVVPRGADVTLRCQGHLWSERFQLWKDGELRDERNAFWQQAEFVLRNVDDWRDARSYRCRSGQGPLWSEFSEALALVVTGTFPKPSISTASGSTVSPGTTVNIWCDVSPQASPQDYSFALLEAKSLEPLQRVTRLGMGATFSLLSVRPKDTGNYSCIYYRKTVPYTGSHPSQILELTVPGLLPRPTLWAQSGLMMAPQSNITLWCSRPKLSSIEKVTFTLWKAATQVSLQQQTSDLWTSFLLPSVTPEDTGNYSCTYKEWTASARASEHSYALELVVPGSLPRPSLSALSGLVVKPGMHVTLQCRQPPQTLLSGMTFTLLKVGTPQPLQSQSPTGTSADFPLLSVRAQDSGNYSCVYHWRKLPCHASEPSEILEIWVTDALPKTSLSVWPQVASEANMTLLCQVPSWSSSFVLYKVKEENNLSSINNTQDGAKFILSNTLLKDSGKYTCRYQLSTSESLWTQPSDLVQLIITGSDSCRTLIISLICVSFLLLLLFLLLLAILHQGFIPVGSSQGESPRRCLCCPCLTWRTCLSHQHEAPREESLYTEVAKERPREPLVLMPQASLGVTYAHLNIRTLNDRKTDHIKRPTEPIIYSTVPGD